jgi:hypothetical protein
MSKIIVGSGSPKRVMPSIHSGDGIASARVQFLLVTLLIRKIFTIVIQLYFYILSSKISATIMSDRICVNMLRLPKVIQSMTDKSSAIIWWNRTKRFTSQRNVYKAPQLRASSSSVHSDKRYTQTSRLWSGGASTSWAHRVHQSQTLYRSRSGN